MILKDFLHVAAVQCFRKFNAFFHSFLYFLLDCLFLINLLHVCLLHVLVMEITFNQEKLVFSKFKEIE